MGDPQNLIARPCERIGDSQLVATRPRVTMSRTLQLFVVALLVVGQVGLLPATAVGEAPRELSIDDADFEFLTESSAATLDVVDDVTTPSPVVLALAGYSRHEDADLLEHDTRRSIYEAVVASPGTYIAEVATSTEIPVSTVRYHVRVLDDEKVIQTAKVRGRHRLFPAHAEDVLLAAAVNDDATAAVIEAIRRREPITVSMLAEELDRAQSTVSYHLARLDDADLVDRHRDGESVLVSLPSSVRAVVDSDVLADA